LPLPSDIRDFSSIAKQFKVKISAMKTVLQVALGILLASVLAFVVRIAFLSFAVEEVKATTNQMIQRQHDRLEQLQQEQRNAEARKQEQARSVAQQRHNEQQLAMKKEQAWFKWYKARPGCDVWKSQDHMVECVNHQMRAKAEFNKLWDQGKLD
jgi:hypothetical protein